MTCGPHPTLRHSMGVPSAEVTVWVSRSGMELSFLSGAYNVRIDSDRELC
jgi:hypothetical protein